jgi:hypothetical protein
MKKPHALLHVLLIELLILVKKINVVKNINISTDYLLQEGMHSNAEKSLFKPADTFKIKVPRIDGQQSF